MKKGIYKGKELLMWNDGCCQRQEGEIRRKGWICILQYYYIITFFFVWIPIQILSCLRFSHSDPAQAMVSRKRSCIERGNFLDGFILF